jgi:hypothetical protein
VLPPVDRIVRAYVPGVSVLPANLREIVSFFGTPALAVTSRLPFTRVM